MKTRNAQRWTAGLMMALGLMGCASAAPSPVSVAPAQATVPTSVVVETVVAPTVDVVDRGWMRFNDNRDGYTALVAEVLVDCANAEGPEQSPDCVRRRGSFEVAYALSALYRMTHDPVYLEAADAAIETKALGKLDRLDAYEASFFLALATERERTKRRTDLHAGAEQVAKQLEAWLTEADDYAFAQRSMFGNEENAAVVLGRLWDWAELTADDA